MQRPINNYEVFAYLPFFYTQDNKVLMLARIANGISFRNDMLYSSVGHGNAGYFKVFGMIIRDFIERN
jgi:hypothetical protein